MSINFHDEKNRFTYASREADETWSGFIRGFASIKDKKVLDIGCGGGIYSKKLADLGALQVTGLDFSKQSLLGAEEYCKDYENIDFKQGNALQTNLTSNYFDVILERAVIHHITHIETNFKEIYRLLKTDGLCIIQDRTPDDCYIPGNSTHLRGFFFEQFPRLKEKEANRRHTIENVKFTLKNIGFYQIKEHKLWETRKIYENKEELRIDLMNRTGRSILHELSDSELEQLTEHIISSIALDDDERIVEQDQWTIWTAIK